MTAIEEAFWNELHSRCGYCGHCGKSSCGAKKSYSRLRDSVSTKAVDESLQAAVAATTKGKP